MTPSDSRRLDRSSETSEHISWSRSTTEAITREGRAKKKHAAAPQAGRTEHVNTGSRVGAHFGRQLEKFPLSLVIERAFTGRRRKRLQGGATRSHALYLDGCNSRHE